MGALSSLESSLFAAERVIQYQDRLGLDDSQRRDVNAIVDALRVESEPLPHEGGDQDVDALDDAALRRVERVVEVEDDVRRAHVRRAGPPASAAAERVAALEAPALEPAPEPLHALLRGAVREGLRLDAS